LRFNLEEIFDKNDDGKSPFLTIAIPTYNRSLDLDRCLSQLCNQLAENDSRVEVLISDNYSTDNTEEIVSRYALKFSYIRYLKNKKNVGPDKNFAQCFSRSRGKYIWLFGDDDILLDGAVDKILSILQSDEYGVVFLNTYIYKTDYRNEATKKYGRHYIIYEDLGAFIKKVHYNLAFISSNIVNKSLVDDEMNIENLFYTNLVQLYWTFSALFRSTKNVYVEECLFAAKLSEFRDYKLSAVFGANFEKIIGLFTEKGIDQRYFAIIRKKLLSSYLPAHIVRNRRGLIGLKKENYFRVFYSMYHTDPYFWIFILPAIVLPARIAYFLFSLVKSGREGYLASQSYMRRIKRSILIRK
jgi:abequosyltransferase